MATENILRREQRLPGSPQEVFAFFADARNLEALTPPLLHFRVVTSGPIAMGAGACTACRSAG
jgi:ligand-binding SRPBCC domain-containing protein